MYAEFARFTDELTIQAMDQVIAGGIAASLGVMRGALMLYVVVAGLLVWGGKVDLWVAIQRGIRAMAIIALLGAATYNSMVRDTFWTTIPNATASSMAGGGVRITAAERFDRVDQAAEHSIAMVDARLSFYTVRANFSVAVAQGVMKLALAFSFALWLAARQATALLICVGPFLLIAFLFDATRSWVMQWIGKLVSLAVWSLCSAILIEIILAGSIFWARRTATNAAGGLSEATDALWKLAIWFAINAIIMLSLPIYASIASNAAAGTALASGAVLGAAGAATGASGKAIRGLTRAMNAGKNKQP